MNKDENKTGVLTPKAAEMLGVPWAANKEVTYVRHETARGVTALDIHTTGPFGEPIRLGGYIGINTPNGITENP